MIFGEGLEPYSESWRPFILIGRDTQNASKHRLLFQSSVSRNYETWMHSRTYPLLYDVKFVAVQLSPPIQDSDRRIFFKIPAFFSRLHPISLTDVHT